MTTDQPDEARVVVVTGAASGMGEATARLFHQRGAIVEIVDLNAERASDVAGELELRSPWLGDVGDSAFCRDVVAGVLERHGRLDVLVNAAGTIHRAGALGTDDADWYRVMRANADGVFFMSRAAVEPMISQSAGVVVNFGSIWGDVGAAGVTAYCASKGAVHQLTKAMALDHVEQGVRIVAVAPGEVDTPMLASQRAEPPTPADLQALADATIPMKRLAQPEEIAQVVVFLASPAASYITGEIVHVDGGYLAR